MVTTGSQKITVWGPGGTPLGILRVKPLIKMEQIVLKRRQTSGNRPKERMQLYSLVPLVKNELT
jgi:hypothetical protein